MTGKDSFRVGKADISAKSVNEVADLVREYISHKKSGYICVSNMRTVVIADNDKEYRDVMNNSICNTADGTPLVWCGHLSGQRKMKRCCGTDIMTSLLSEQNLSHFFLGDTDETLDKLIEICKGKYGSVVAGKYSPPFLPLEQYDIPEMAAMIKESKADIVWTSLRAPKQDFLNSMLFTYLDNGVVLIGVGAAFRFITGEYVLDKGPLQKIGLGGLKCLRNTSFFKELFWYIKHAAYLCKFIVKIIYNKLFSRDDNK